MIRARAGEAAYDVCMGRGVLSGALGRDELAAAERVAVIASSRVYELHRDRIDGALGPLRGRCRLAMMDDREENKSYARAEGFLEEFLARGMNRKSAVIGIGGGVVGDFAGYCAGLYMRGIPVVHVPTTLLAMVDSSIGGKVAVNLSAGKNIAGLFHRPSMVVSDFGFLDTLPDGEFRNGLTEAFKHGLIGDGGTLALFERSAPDELRREPALAELVERSVSFKSGIVQRDEREEGLRAVLNYGHTVAHAVESFTGLRSVSHGEAVAAGIRVANELSCRMGMLDRSFATRAAAVMEAHGLTHRVHGLDIEGVIGHMEYDKKNFGGAVKFVLLRKPGDPVVNQSVPAGLLREVMKDVLG